MKKIFRIIFSLTLIIVGCLLLYYQKDINLIEKTNHKKESKVKSIIKDNDIKKSIFKNQYSKAQKIVNEMTLEEKIGQLFLVRYNKNDVEYLSNFNPGGYILFAKDFENNTKETMKEEIKQAQKLNKYPLIMGVDEEGGYVTRVSRFKSYRNEKFKSPKDYYNEGGYDLVEKTEKEKAELLTSLGLNLNLAPVADVSTNPDDFIYIRTFQSDANTTSEYISKMVKYAHDNKINSCLKHFPGYGNNEDTHTGIAIDNRSYEDIKNNDYLPFKSGIDANVPSILVSHNIVTSIDSEHPSSLSKKVVAELRNTLGFTGIIMTDDLDMDAVKEYAENKEAATLAINAGNDMIITGDFINMYKELLESVKNKKIEEETINKAVLRIIAWKYYSNLFKE